MPPTISGVELDPDLWESLYCAPSRSDDQRSKGGFSCRDLPSPNPVFLALEVGVSGGISSGLLIARKVIGAILSKENKKMLWTVFVILLVLWLLGLVTSYTFGGFVHILLLLAVVALVFQLLSGRRAV